MNQGPYDLETVIASLDLLDHRHVDWKRVQRTAYLVHQHLRYNYPGPIYDLDQRLMIVPPEHYGDQRRVVYRLEVSAPDFATTEQHDEYGNLVLNVHIPKVEETVDFEAWIVVERHLSNEPQRIPLTLLTDPRFLHASDLTQPDETLRQAAETLAQHGEQGLALAQRINDWTHSALTYEHDVTTVRTTASEALALGRGVCQDYSHIMLTLCRLCGLPARYVSGHLLGEGGTHAWVEVLLPSNENPHEGIAVPFDPTNGNRADLSYLTIATGRDYYDVAPTSGTFRASYRGQLSARKRVGLTVLEYTDTAIDK
jgi:transglutaminase-like putative cysteine protease